MSTFSAGSAVKPLKWSFKPFLDAEGTIPEPTQDAVQAFFEVLQSAARRAQIIGQNDVITSAADAEAALDRIGDDLDQAREIADEVEEALVALCGGSPDRDTLKAVPYRVRNKFSQWLMKEIRPEA